MGAHLLERGSRQHLVIPGQPQGVLQVSAHKCEQVVSWCILYHSVGQGGYFMLPLACRDYLLTSVFLVNILVTFGFCVRVCVCVCGCCFCVIVCC